MRKNISGQIVAFQAISSTDGSDVTTGSPVVYYTIDGGTQAQTTASAVHEGNGQWTVALTQAETNGDHIAFSFVLTGAISQTLNVYTINADITNLDAAISSRSTFNSASDEVTVSTNNDKTGYSISGTKTTLDDLNDIAASAIVSGGAITTSGGAVSNVTLVDTTTTNSDMRGTDGANTVAPDNASIAAILVDTGTDIPASIAALNNFNPATDTVANVTTVGSVTNPVATDAASRTASQADVSALATAASIAALNDLSSTDVTNAVWDASTSSHNVAGSFGRGFRQVKEGLVSIDGQVNDLSATTTSFVTNLATAVDDYYNGQTLHFISGSLAGQSQVIRDYNGTTKTITLDSALTAAPSNADEFIVLSTHVHTIGEIADGVWGEAQSGHTTVGTFGYYLDSQVSGISSGGGDASAANQTTIISHLTDIKGGTFSGSTDSLEAIRDRGDAAWTTGGASGSGLYQVTVTVEDASNNALQGARIAVDGTNLILTTPSNGQVTFNLDSGVYLLTCSPPAGYDTPTDVVVSVSTSDVTAEFTLTPTSSASCDVPWIG
jgi:hypothetical protein